MAFKWKSIVVDMHNTAANKKPLHQQHMGQRLRFARQALLTPLRLRGRKYVTTATKTLLRQTRRPRNGKQMEGRRLRRRARQQR